jgi:hypothetical protein
VCKPASTGTFAVVECGDADAEENESRTYAGASWPASATVSVPALQVRFRAEDSGDARTTGTATSSSKPSGSNKDGGDAGSGGSGGGLSAGVKAAIGTVIPLVFITLALAVFLLWRRRRHNKAVAQNEKAFAESGTYSDTKPNDIGAAAGTSHRPSVKETPEWNTELEATEAQRQSAAAPVAAVAPVTAVSPVTAAAPAAAAHISTSELGGLARKPRKPVPAIEMEGSAVPAEMDVSRYMAYQPLRNQAPQS